MNRFGSHPNRENCSLYQMGGLLPHDTTGTMNAATPDGAPPWRIGNKKNLKKILPAVPRRGPEAGVHHIRTIFMIPV